MVKTLLDRVVVKPVRPDQKGAILLPKQRREYDLILGDVIDVGPDVTNCSVGDRVLYDRTKSQDVSHLGARHCEVLRQTDVCAKIGGSDEKRN